MRALSLLLAALWIGAAGPCPMGPGVPCPSVRIVKVGLTGSVPAGWTFTRSGTTATQQIAGQIVAAGANVARFETDLNGKPLGLLIEPAVETFVDNNTMVGISAGSPGTLPTYWTQDGVGLGLTQTISAASTINGISYFNLTIA